MPDLAVTKSKPLLKWPGGKRALAASIGKEFPNTFGTYYEPFLGGGAVFFALSPKTAVLADINEELINCYLVVRDHPQALLDALGRLKNTADDYYRIRDTSPRTQVTRAARFLYLTRLSFNGIHRVNLNGKFNVPYGYKEHITAFDEKAILTTSKSLAQATLLCCDFESATASAVAGDVIYFDPPYTVAHANNGFVKYNEKIFSWADQVRLANHCRDLANRGCCVVVSNADHASVRDLYKGARTSILERHSVISAASAHRRMITECVFVLGGPDA